MPRQVGQTPNVSAMRLLSGCPASRTLGRDTTRLQPHLDRTRDTAKADQLDFGNIRDQRSLTHRRGTEIARADYFLRLNAIAEKNHQMCARTVEVSGFCKVELSKLPFRELAEAEIGFLTMSGSELRRVEVVAEVVARRRTEESAAVVLGLSARQTRRLVRAYRDGGGGALIHKARGKNSKQPADRRSSRVHGGAGEDPVRRFWADASR